MSLVLAFDCAVSGLAIAIVGDGTRLAGIAEEGRDQAARLLPAIAAALAEAGVGRRELSLIAVTIGPGSFTGVRVGLAAARGLAVGLGVPLAGLATTRVLLAQARPRGRTVALPPSTAAWVTGSAPSARGWARRTASRRPLSRRRPSWRCAWAAGRASSSGRRADARAAARGGRIDAVAEEALPDPLIIARLAADAGVDAWRARNAREGLPRPLYLRGVNITLPDGARRTVD